MLIRYYVCSKQGHWFEISDEDMEVVEGEYGQETTAQQHARMARLHGIEGGFRIEVRRYKYYPEIYEVLRRASGTTAVLSNTPGRSRSMNSTTHGICDHCAHVFALELRGGEYVIESHLDLDGLRCVGSHQPAWSANYYGWGDGGQRTHQLMRARSLQKKLRLNWFLQIGSACFFLFGGWLLLMVVNRSHVFPMVFVPLIALFGVTALAVGATGLYATLARRKKLGKDLRAK